MKQITCPLPVVAILFGSMVAFSAFSIVFLLQDCREIILIDASTKTDSVKSNEEILRLSCENETISLLISVVTIFLNDDETMRSKINETDIIEYSNFMQMCARQRAISACDQISEKGNYCGNYSVEADEGFIIAVKEKKLFHGKRVASFGVDTGLYREALENDTIQFDGFDVNPFIEYLSEGKVKFFDLTVPTHFPKKYDITISLDVLGHIPAEFGSTALRNLAESSKDILIISWAKPGLALVNEKPREYVVDIFRKHGFKVDEVLSKYLRKNCKLDWHSNNILLLRKMK